MARSTVATLEARMDARDAQLDARNAQLDAKLDKLFELVAAAAQPKKAAAQPKKAAAQPKKSWLKPCPDYATAAQRVEYDKLAERARGQLQAMKQALGTESVSCFIPVPREANRMPHSIRWNATYSK